MRNNRVQPNEEVHFNCFKAVYYACKSYNDTLNFKLFSERLNVNETHLINWFTINQNVRYLDKNLFKKCRLDKIRELENIISVPKKDSLIAGRKDDFNGVFLHYYSIFKNQINENINFQIDKFVTTKIVVFDFDGTLTKRGSTASSWESIWTELGYPVTECMNLHTQFDQKKITHEKWCDITCKKFQDRNLTKNTIKNVSTKIKLIGGTANVFKTLEKRDIEILILSGSIKQIIQNVLESKNILPHVSDYMANEFIYNEDESLSKIIGTKYDFEGKADYLSEIIIKKNIQPYEVLYIGNSNNDEFTYKSGVRTLCVNPKYTSTSNKKVWHNCIPLMNNLTEIYPFIYGHSFI